MRTSITRIALVSLIERGMELEQKVDLLEAYIFSRDGSLKYWQEYAGLHQADYLKEVIG